MNKEIEELRRKLAERKKVEKVDAEVQKAKDELVACLRLNDRRPLDCWREKEEFKRQVGRLEREFVKRTGHAQARHVISTWRQISIRS